MQTEYSEEERLEMTKFDSTTAIHYTKVLYEDSAAMTAQAIQVRKRLA